MTRGQDFADLVYKLLIIDKRLPLAEVADQMGISYHSLHARIHKKTTFSPEEVRSLITILREPEIIDYLVMAANFIAIDRQEPLQEEDTDGVFRRVNRIAIETADVLGAVEKAMSDNRLDHRDKAEIMREIIDAERSLASLRAAIGEP